VSLDIIYFELKKKYDEIPRFCAFFSLDLDQSYCGKQCFQVFVFFFLLQKSMKREHFLWQLFNIHNDYVKTIKDLEDEERSREGVVKELENFENEASKKKKEQAKYLKEIALREKRINEKNSKLDKSVSIFPILLRILSS